MDPADASLDADDDGLSNLVEWQQGTRANNADTDGDSVNDGVDIAPGNPFEHTDTDGDGTGNHVDPDDDNDGFSDVREQEQGTDPLNIKSVPVRLEGWLEMLIE